MKKLILFILFVEYLVLTSCTETRDPSKGIVYSFYADFFWPKYVPSGRNSLLNIKLNSDAYRDGSIQHEGFYTDNKNSFIISPKGDTIKSNEIFNISSLNKFNGFSFYSEDLGEHIIKFTFKNSMGFTITKKQKLMVEKATFKFTLNPFYKEVKIKEPLNVEYSIEAYDQLEHTYQLKFEFEDVSTKLDATLNNHKAGEWFDISEMSGKLTYIPLISGTHKVKISSKNDMGVEKTENFTVISIGEGYPVVTSYEIKECVLKEIREGVDIGRYICNDSPLKFTAYSGRKDLKINKIETFMIVNGNELPISRRNYNGTIVNSLLDRPILYKQWLPISLEAKIEITNSAGFKTVFTKPIKVN